MLNDYKYAIGTMKQADDYNKITTYLILYIRKTYEHGSDIANAIENQETKTQDIIKHQDIRVESPRKASNQVRK